MELKENTIRNGMLFIDADDVYRAYELLSSNELVQNASIFGSALHASLSGKSRSVKESTDALKEYLTSNGIRVQVIRPVLPSLEDVFLETIEND